MILPHVALFVFAAIAMSAGLTAAHAGRGLLRHGVSGYGVVAALGYGFLSAIAGLGALDMALLLIRA